MAYKDTIILSQLTCGADGSSGDWYFQPARPTDALAGLWLVSSLCVRASATRFMPRLRLQENQLLFSNQENMFCVLLLFHDAFCFFFFPSLNTRFRPQVIVASAMTTEFARQQIKVALKLLCSVFGAMSFSGYFRCCKNFLGKKVTVSTVCDSPQFLIQTENRNGSPL